MSIYTIYLSMMGLFAVGIVVRIIMGPTIWDRLLGFNTLSAKVIMAIVLVAVMTDRSYLLDVALAYAFLGFIGTVLFARFIEKKGEL